MEIFINQEGYLPKEEKYFIINNKAKSFTVKSEENNQESFSGSVSLWKENDTSTGETLYVGYFTDLTQNGKYFIVLDDGSKSFSFNIKDDVFNNVRDKSLKSYYYQRSGIELEEKYAGIFARKAGHIEKLEYHHSSPIEGKKDVSGGWYDAGDYGRYIIPASVSLAVMLMGYEQYPEKFKSDDINIPESSNGIPDFLDEMRYELEWMLKMQHREEGKFKGALPYMLNSLHRVDGLPAEASACQYIYDFSSVATADFSAAMALSSRLYKSIDKEFANKCLDASILAWDFLRVNGNYPEGGFQRPSDTTTGGYAEEAKDNYEDYNCRLWAALELYLTTGSTEYHDYFVNNYKLLTNSWNMAWNDATGFAKIQYILGDKKLLNSEIQKDFTDSFIEYCNTNLLRKIDSNGFKLTIDNSEYVWGSNGELLNRAEQLIFAYQLTKDKKYYNGALAQLNYVLGLNIHNISFVTYTGTNFPKVIHHGIGFATDFKDVIPGLIAGGPNCELDGDTTLPKYFDEDTPPAKCYIDHRDSWASNESCILYNAPLVPVSAFFSK